MNYIKTVILRNFQSHKHTVVDFDNKLNVIVGPSDSGKTAILRGIKWALYNDPSGDYFIREGASECSVTIIFSDNKKIKRFRSKSKNIYYLYDENDKELKFESFGVSVPDEIIEATGIKKILLDKNVLKSINISDQLEGAFLLSEKGSIRASSIGYLVGVDIVDDALKESLRESRNLSNNKRSIDENIMTLEMDLSKYDYLNKLDTKVKKLDSTLDKIKEKEIILLQYKEILSKFSKVTSEKIKLNNYTKELEKTNKLEILINNIELHYIKYRQINRQLILLKKVNLNKKTNDEIVDSVRNIHIIKNNIKKISLLYDKNSKLIKINAKLKSNYEDTKKYNIINDKLIDLDNLEDKIKQINNEFLHLKELSQLNEKGKLIRKSLTTGYMYISRLKEIDKINQKYSKIHENLNILNDFMKIASKFKTNEKITFETEKKLKVYLSDFNIISNKYKKILLEAKTCPLCFSQIDNKKANYIVSQYR